MRPKAASGKAIIVLCLASFLAGSLFMSRSLSRSYVSEEEDKHLAKHLSKRLEIQKDCDEHKRVITPSVLIPAKHNQPLAHVYIFTNNNFFSTSVD